MTLKEPAPDKREWLSAWLTASCRALAARGPAGPRCQVVTSHALHPTLVTSRLGDRPSTDARGAGKRPESRLEVMPLINKQKIWQDKSLLILRTFLYTISTEASQHRLIIGYQVKRRDI